MRTIPLLLTVILVATPVAFAAPNAYTFNNNPSSLLHSPSATVSYNPSNGPITIQRPSTGNYKVTFTGLGPTAARGVAHVAIVQGNFQDCRAWSWGVVGNDIVVNVRCFSLEGSVPNDNRFTVLYTSI